MASRLVLVVAVAARPAVEALLLGPTRSPSCPLPNSLPVRLQHRAQRTAPTCSASPAIPWVAGCIASGSLGVPLVAGAVKSWYTNTLVKPSWTPPNRVFAPTWCLLYGLNGFAASRVATAVGGPVGSPVLVLAWSHHALNLLWAPAFFGLRQLRAGVAINLALLASLIPIAAGFARVTSTATAALLAPYTAWLLFATALNIRICRLNPKGVPRH